MSSILFTLTETRLHLNLESSIDAIFNCPLNISLPSPYTTASYNFVNLLTFDKIFAKSNILVFFGVIGISNENEYSACVELIFVGS